ncbi:two-component sensor histidine kinase [Chryseobacterium ginsenosidimutans]|uniref:tetratricopeptide repeat-containing sensor histidine kinase n=1 Tax=Chryseobacterium ginsenosidimutans TaxID=687846 RepID=UPI00216A286A|nr:tetratricopeptide repeat protein [Chryseobacterium ginsenosidimutans]MCS3869545.1 two-component sensor histidine kinase [Chryseobacterium ginsenosidimutans]
MVPQKLIRPCFYVSRYILTYIFVLAPLFVGAQSIFKTNEEAFSAERRLKSDEDDKDKVDLFLSLSNYYYERDKYNIEPVSKSIVYAKQAFTLSKTLKYTKGIGASYLILSMLEQHDNHFNKSYSYASAAINILDGSEEYDLLGESWVMIWSSKTLMGMKYEDRIFYLKKAAEYFAKSNNKRRLGDCYKEMGDIYLLMGNGKEALNCLKKALPFYQQSHYKKLDGIYDLLGATYMFLGDYKEGLKYGFLALDTAEKIGDKKTFLCTIYNRIGLAYEEMNDYQNALQYYEKSLKVAEDFNNIKDIRAIVGNISRALLKNGEYNKALTLITDIKKEYPKIDTTNSFKLDCTLIRIYVHKKQYGKALPYQTKIISKIEEVHDYDILVFIYTTLIDLNLALKDYEKAVYYNKLHLNVCKKLNKDSYYADYNLWEFKIDSAKGYLKPALMHYKEYVRFNKRYFDEKKSNEINKLNVLYETEKKDKYITNLKSESIIQNGNLEKASLIRNIMFAGFVILLASIYFLYRAYQSKQKNNLILKEQQDQIRQSNISLKNAIHEKEWLLREIHHRVKNNLHMVVGLLASQNEYLQGHEAIDANLESQRRVESMSMIHDKLYQSENLSMIDMPSYILDLTYYLSDSFDVRKQIRFSLDIEKVDFPLSHSVPIGLILNEAVTNSIKYAFPENRQGVVTIILKKEEERFHLTVWDDGIGIPETISPENSKSLGLKLMKGLSEDILADFKICNESGTKIELIFTI